jgi:hypothetical protein
LFWYRGAPKDGGTLEYVFEAGVCWEIHTRMPIIRLSHRKSTAAHLGHQVAASPGKSSAGSKTTCNLPRE